MPKRAKAGGCNGAGTAPCQDGAGAAKAARPRSGSTAHILRTVSSGGVGAFVLVGVGTTSFSVRAGSSARSRCSLVSADEVLGEAEIDGILNMRRAPPLPAGPLWIALAIS